MVSRSLPSIPPTPARRRLTALALALVLGALLGGCGSSSGGSTITVGNEPSGQAARDSAAASAPVTNTQTTATSTTPSVPTPTSGPLAKEPKVSVPSGPAPTHLVTHDLITGKGAAAAAGQTVTVNYVGVLFKGGKQFDASWTRKQTFSFPLGQRMVIPGWDQGVPGMRVGGRRELIIPASLGYGAKGSPPVIPPNAPLVFVIDLLGT